MAIKQAVVAAIIGVALVASNSVLAAKSKFKYSYADVGYQHTSGDVVDLDGGFVDASFGIFDLIALRAGFTRAQTDGFQGDSPDLTEFRAGLRGHYAFAKTFDVFVDALGFNNKLNGNQTTATDIGIIYELGGRFMAAKKLELNASYKYIGGELNEDFGTVGAVFKLSKAFALSAKAEVSSDSENYFAGVRFNF